MVEKRAAQRDAFIVRVWREEGQTNWQGWVQHVRTGEEVCVRSSGELAAFIESRSLTWPERETAVAHLK